MFQKLARWNAEKNNMPLKAGIIVLSICVGAGAGFILARALEGAEVAVAAAEIAAASAEVVDMI